MKFFSLFAILLVSFFSVEAFQYDLTLPTMNFKTPAIKGELTATIKGQKETMNVVFDENIFRKYKKINAEFEFPEVIQDITLNFKAVEDKESEFAVGPMIAAILEKSEIHIYTPYFDYKVGDKYIKSNEMYISEAHNVKYVKV